jgi:protein required for attachment to host cells
MNRYLIVVADGARARFFTADFSTGGTAVRLAEHEDLLNPERSLRGRDEFSNLKSGRNRAPPRGPAHGYDDHRLRHREELERRFARSIAEASARVVRREKPSCFVVVAEPRLLGMLRSAFEAALPPTLPRTEVAHDLSWHALPNIRAELEKQGVLPESQPSPASWRPRVQPPPKRLQPTVPPAARRVSRQSARPRRVRSKAG